jgi:signal transduction histidine kinase
VLKHAGTYWAQVTIERGERFLGIEVRDEGRGIENVMVALDQRERFGLASLQERIGYLNGTVAIDSEPGRGTAIRLQVPLGTIAGARRRR